MVTLSDRLGEGCGAILADPVPDSRTDAVQRGQLVVTRVPSHIWNGRKLVVSGLVTSV
jgi:hypothetical protein